MHQTCATSNVEYCLTEEACGNHHPTGLKPAGTSDLCTSGQESSSALAMLPLKECQGLAEVSKAMTD